ncbi:hypothetical protein [Desulfitobacterium metallireducens]|uniref:Uncharacterized protein n=1 Tax=Desulfitobacterium metallireducens DSM 15288 TaxID=871968 RepID=W0ED44_9FIRM|nr:hypothetical protein [Desulfitobacterium metallireducens]AHF08657.1 hypothetical protein DESME_12900 [Desulfitobacterium metallireducens DSM 15288]
MEPYRKLYFIWYFDDDKGYGIEVFGERLNTSTRSETNDHSKFKTLVNWSFGHGTWARNLRRSWGDFAANRVAQNQGSLPLEIENIVLRFNVEEQVLEGDIKKIENMLKSEDNRV